MCRRWDSERASQDRSEAAGTAILPLLDQIRDFMKAAKEDGQDDVLLDRAADQVERLALQVADGAVRQRLRDIATSVKRPIAIQSLYGHTKSQVGWNARICGQNAVGVLMGTEELQENSIIDDYVAAITDEDDIYEERALLDRAKRAGIRAQAQEPD